MQIDTSPYEQKVLQAASGLDQANNNLANQSQAIEQHKADIAAAQPKLNKHVQPINSPWHSNNAIST